MTRIAVIGASGFLAGHVIPQLIADGHEVRGLARTAPQWSPSPMGPGFTFISGDVRNVASVSATVDGADWVIHLATSRRADDPIPDIIVRGTETVLAAAGSAKRLLFVSCLGADASSHSLQYRSKWQAERLVRSSDIPHVILRPSLIVGSGDGIMRPLAHVLRTLPVVPVPTGGENRVQPIDVQDVVRCISLSLRGDETLGESVDIGGPMYLTFRQLVDLVASAEHVNRRKLLVPSGLSTHLRRFLPAASRELYAGRRLEPFQYGVVTSPGVVDRHFGFAASNTVPAIESYLAGEV